MSQAIELRGWTPFDTDCAGCGEPVISGYAQWHQRLGVWLHGNVQCQRDVNGEDVRLHTMYLVAVEVLHAAYWEEQRLAELQDVNAVLPAPIVEWLIDIAHEHIGEYGYGMKAEDSDQFLDRLRTAHDAFKSSTGQSIEGLDDYLGAKA